MRTRPFWAIVDVGRRDRVPVVVDVRAREPKATLRSRYRAVRLPFGVEVKEEELAADVALSMDDELVEVDW